MSKKNKLKREIFVPGISSESKPINDRSSIPPLSIKHRMLKPVI